MIDRNTLRAVIERKSIPVPGCGCWLWERSTYPSGYGETGITNAPRRAHRASYAAFIGQIPAGAVVCHKCDTPSCVNPDHLFLGSQFDNMADCARKHRHGTRTHPSRIARGERHGMAKLDFDVVKRIRARRKDGISYRALAVEFEISPTHACEICRGLVWSEE